MAMSKQDYADLGRRNAQDRADPTRLVAPHPYEEGATSWQARAYWEAFYAETERLGGMKQVNAASIEREVFAVDSMTPIKPKAKGDGNAAQEHIRELYREMRATTGRGIRGAIRRDRLSRKISKLVEKHGDPV